MQGTLSPGVLPVVLRDVYLRRLTGLLRVRAGDEQLGLSFAGGHIVCGQATSRDLHMGAVMMSAGLLGADDLARATVRVTLEKKRLGQVLEELGIVPRSKIEEALALHARGVLVKLFDLADGSFQFERAEARPPAPDDYPLAQSTGEIVLQAARLVARDEAVRFGLGDPDRVLLPATDPLVRFRPLSLTPAEAFVASRADGVHTAREVMQVSPMKTEEVERALLGLLSVGLVEQGARPRVPDRGSADVLRQEILFLHARLGASTHFDVLGLGPQATDAEVKAAYYRLAKRYHPDVHHEPALSDLGDKLDAIFFRLNEAYQVLSHPVARRRYEVRAGLAEPLRFQVSASSDEAALVRDALSEALDTGLDQAEAMFGRAREFYGEGRVWESVALLDEVVRRSTGVLRARARVLLSRALAKHPDRGRDVETMLVEALQEEPDNAEAYMLLAGVYDAGGRHAQAEAMYAKVLSIHPGHKEATEALRRTG